MPVFPALIVWVLFGVLLLGGSYIFSMPLGFDLVLGLFSIMPLFLLAILGFRPRGKPEEKTAGC